MIRKLRLKNYRCFEDSEIDFKKNTIIVGSNNAGKSTLTEALRIIGLAAKKFRNMAYVQAPSELLLPAITRGFYLHVEDIKIDLRTIVYYYKTDTAAEIVAFFDERTEIHVFLRTDFVFVTIMVKGKTITRKSDAIKSESLNLHILPQLSMIMDDEKKLNPETVTKEIETRLSSRHFRNEILYYKETSFDLFKELAQRTWPGLRIQKIEYDYSDNYVRLFVHDGGYTSEVGLMGSGLQMWLQIIWFISRNNPEATVVLDEPDVYMHPDLQRKLFNIVKQRFSQVIIATHSVEIMSCAEPDQIVTVDKTTRKMKYAYNYSAVQDIIVNLGSVHNLSLSKLGSARKCVFVEGKDIKTLAKLQARYDLNNICVDQLPIVELGGWKRFNEALGASRLFFQETSGEIKTYCILDRDYHRPEEIEELYQKAEENHLILHVWKKKEIENYLFSVDSLFRMTNMPQEERTAFDQELFSILDQLKEQTIDGIMDQLQSYEKGKAASTYRKEAEKIIQKPWETLIGRLSVANGKELISLINSWMKRQYRISCSRNKLIQSLQPEDVDQEIKDTIQELIYS